MYNYTAIMVVLSSNVTWITSRSMCALVKGSLFLLDIQLTISSDICCLKSSTNR